MTRVLRGVADAIAALVGASPSASAVSEDDVEVTRRDWERAVHADLMPALGDAYLAAANALAADLTDAGRDVQPVTLDAPDAVDFLDAATNRLVGVADTLWEAARRELADGVRAGEGVDELATRLQQAAGFGPGRAATVARTEVIGAANAASLAQAMRLGDPGVRKEWLATMDGPACDERTRAAHCAAHEQTQPLSEPFEVGGTWLMYPGQPIGPPDEVINCRCTVGYLVEDSVDDPLTAAAEVHTGAMVALIPTVEDADRLAVDGGEPADQLHTTLAYLGEGADISPDAREAILDAVSRLAEDMQALTVDGFSVNAFNLGEANDRDACLVLGLSGDGLVGLHDQAIGALREIPDFALPEQHAPWQPHVTLTYTDDLSMVETLADRVGPVTFDAIRVAFAGEAVDIPLGQPGADDSDETEDDDFDWDTHVAQVIQATLQSQMPEHLQRYWIRRLRLGTPGSFRRCVRQLRRHYPQDTEGLCANLYHEATGRWPGRKKTNAAADVDTAPPEFGAVPPEADAAPVEQPPPDLAGPQPGEHFHTRVMEGVSTGLRQFAPGALTWREPPFAYHWQYKSAAHGGLPETAQVGIVTRVERDGDTVHLWGRLDLRSPEGLDYARRLADGFARWSSVGADESVKDRHIDVEYVITDDPDSDELPEVDEMTFNAYRIAEVTAVSVPALADATVEPTPELVDTLTEMGVLAPAPHAAEPAGAAAMTDPDVPPPPTTGSGEVTVDLNDDDTITLGWLGADGATEVTLSADDAVTLAGEIETVLTADEPVTGQVGSLAISRSEAGELVLASGDGPLAVLSPADAEALVVVLRDFGGAPDTEEPEEDAMEDAAVVAATPPRQVLRSAVLGTPSAADVTAVPGVEVVVASGCVETHTITIPHVPPPDWFTEPSTEMAAGALTITDEGRLYGYLAPAGVAHRAFRGRRVEVPMGNVDYGRWMGGEAIVAGGGRVIAGPITMNCGHMPPHASSDPGARMEHYDNTCSVVAQAAIGENRHGVWIAGALLPGVSAEQVSRMLACRLSGDWAPHPEKHGWREFVAALLVPVPGFPMARTAPSTVRVTQGALVAAAVPVRLEMSTTPPEPNAEPEVKAEPNPEPDVVVADGAPEPPDLRQAMERVARTVGMDAATRMAALRDRVGAHR